MPLTLAHRIRRGVFVGLGAIIILAVGIYGPATLVGPLPAATATVLSPAPPAVASSPPTLPQTGASGISVGDNSTVLATAGQTDAVPLGGTAKVILALVVLDAKPVDAGTAGPSIVVTAEDYAGYVDYIANSARAVSFITGESWTEREFLQAILLGSSNNHSDALARWAFGSVDGYLTAAKSWLARNGLPSTTVVDATGLSGDSVGTASDLTRVTQLAFENPLVAEIMAEPTVTVNKNRVVNNLATYLPEQGVTGLSLSYTDQAGLCFLFSATVTVAGSTVPIYGALLREPDYDTLHQDMVALVASAPLTLKPSPVVTAGDAFVRYDTAWGQSAQGVALAGDDRMLWAPATTAPVVSAAQVTTALGGTSAGSVAFDLPGGPLTVPLKLSATITDPGPLWRLTHPVPVIQAFLDSRH
ncbi:D-alanyl-D-alanine carboxypeptidase family protein [Subtercola frigoramans]|uniref:D-alanyl-D-alanine carboxypeptidase (Penicillin-binding protein 5/6) n=1 Tax=Subtercola frigoramans TaxID=120298 RepID=A0ABS2L7C1_9MICO|nr:hypothetical protein [Subtercola frigoramans]MBM7472776.1 D-alanyl-D-alanine carboxypeptidase (penicillin-binding protein 5/6) [Subtercola frigoramans]